MLKQLDMTIIDRNGGLLPKCHFLVLDPFNDFSKAERNAVKNLK